MGKVWTQLFRYENVCTCLGAACPPIYTQQRHAFESSSVTRIHGIVECVTEMARPTTTSNMKQHFSVPKAVIDASIHLTADWIHQQQVERLWASERMDEGVVLRKEDGQYVCHPRSLHAVPWVQFVIQHGLEVLSFCI
jgi:hypothetical protein